MEKELQANCAGHAMWQLVERHTGHVGYRAGAKENGLAANPPVIDCSGWVSLLLSAAMRAVNDGAHKEVFSAGEIAAICTWSDRIIQKIETRTGTIIEGDRINLANLPQYATIGLRQGGGVWASNQPRPRGITHIVQIVRRPDDDAAFVSEAQGWKRPFGVRLLNLDEWLETTQAYLKAGESWAVDPLTPGRRTFATGFKPKA